jgi:hypothetical protein
MKEYHLKRAVVSDPVHCIKPGRAPIQLLVIALLCSGLLLGCAQNHKVTYPDNYVYLGHNQITSEMALLSDYMKQIDEILFDDSTISSEQQAQIAKILLLIDVSTDSLGAGSVETNHLIIDEHIDQFKSDVNVALRNARSDPPNYFPLGKLAGSCDACHQYR